MEHAPQSGVSLHDGQRVAVSLAVVDDHRQVQLQRQLQLGPEHLLLEVAGRVLRPVVVKADLTDGHHLGFPRHPPQRVHVLRHKVAAVLRMDAHGGVHMGVPRRQIDSRLRGRQRAAGGDHQTVKGGKHRVTVGVKGLVVIMGVGVEQRHTSCTLPMEVSSMYWAFSSRRRVIWGCCMWTR